MSDRPRLAPAKISPVLLLLCYGSTVNPPLGPKMGRSSERMIKVRFLFLLVVASLLAVTAAPVGAAGGKDPRAARDQARNKRAKLAKELDVLKASDAQLERAIVALNSQVAAQSAQAQAARQAAEAADAELAAVQQQLSATQARIVSITGALVDRAVSSFIRPNGADDAVAGSDDIAVVARKAALLAQVAATDQDLIDQLDKAEDDLEVLQQQATAVAGVAAARRRETQSRLNDLKAARAEKLRLDKQVEQRKAEVLAEIDAAAKAEAQLSAILARASRQGVSPDMGAGRGGCIWPTRGSVTSEYGSRWGRLHAGIDIATSIGTPIWAAKAGTVIFAGTMDGYGNTVVVDHGDGLSTLYGHQSRIAAGDGNRVSQGQVIGYVGNTGRSTGPHLHFETRYGGSARNPRGCLP